MAQSSLEKDKLIPQGTEILPGFVYRMLNETDLPEVKNIIDRYYSHQHPIRHIFKLSKQDIEGVDFAIAEEMVRANACFGTFQKQTGQLIAFAMKTTENISESAINHASARERNPFLARFAEFMSRDVFKDLNTDRYMYWSMACVKAEYRSKGIISAMLDFDFVQGSKNGCEYVVAIASSAFSQKALKHGGFKVLREVKYADYIDIHTGLKPDLNLSPIHTSCQLTYKRVQPSEAETKKTFNTSD